MKSWHRLKNSFSIILVSFLSGFSEEAPEESNDSTISYKQVRFVKFNQANDLFQYLYRSDQNYSDGVDFELALPAFGNKAFDKILWGVKETPYKDFSLSFNQDMFTPVDVENPDVITTDRPYAALLYFSLAKYSNNFWEGYKIITELYLGVMGPMALGEQAQNTVHRWLGNKYIAGWSHQLGNGLVADYEVQILREIPISSPITEFHGFGTLRLGTTYNYTDAGLRFKIGLFTDTYMNFYGMVNSRYKHHFTADDMKNLNNHRKRIIPKKIREQSELVQAEYLNKKLNRKYQAYFYAEGKLRYMLRDGSVEGSIISFRSHEHRYYYNDYNHFNIIGRYGVVIQISHIYLEYMRYLKNDVFNESDDGVFGYGRVIFSVEF